MTLTCVTPLRVEENGKRVPCGDVATLYIVKRDESPMTLTQPMCLKHALRAFRQGYVLMPDPRREREEARARQKARQRQ